MNSCSRWLAAALLLTVAGCSGQGAAPAAGATADAREPLEVPVDSLWRLEPEASSLTFVSIKNHAVAEVHRFGRFTAFVDAEGQARLQVALDSVQTGIGIRDQRMRAMLFETRQFPLATVSLPVDPQAVNALIPGAHQLFRVEATLDLHGVALRVPALLRVTRLDAQRWLVTSESPVLVNATQFGLINGIEALRNAAGLQAIGSGVPVSFALSFVAGDGTPAGS